MSLVMMDEHFLQLLHSGILLDHYHALLERSAATDDGRFASILVHPFTVFGLRYAVCLFIIV